MSKMRCSSIRFVGYKYKYHFLRQPQISSVSSVRTAGYPPVNIQKAMEDHYFL